eukprot:TRINITY_DN13092_c0_g1_i1.p1 TRINITY_DN13092_c0_g1~~TRINITY_DN13092_c0_g1_i1.p1  ORF type:complete len:132 (+),score=22.77 TRINITY_DN13092_c0_g1_i1:70-465(+)
MVLGASQRIGHYLLKERSMSVGGRNMTFYEPLTLNQFVIHCWSWKNGHTEAAPVPQRTRQFSLNLYEDGNVVDPLKDSRFKDLSVIQEIASDRGNWADSSFTFNKLDHLLGEVIGDVSPVVFEHLSSPSPF